MIGTDQNNSINLKRLTARYKEMIKIGKTENGGISRLALSEDDRRARLLLIRWMQEIGLDVRIDDVGNIYGTLISESSDASPVMTGSHLDSVPRGGKFDGTLGVLAALEAVESLIESRRPLERPIEIVSFSNEEGARFTPQMLGSGVITGKFSKEYVYGRRDSKGKIYKEELNHIGFLGEEENRPKDVHCFLELHIEQGPVLEKENLSIGIVEGIAGFCWLEIKIKGQADHSGATPMSMRKDSLVVAANIIQRLSRWAGSKEDGTVATVGRIWTYPDSVNVIPGETIFTLDIRNRDHLRLSDHIKEVKEMISQTAMEANVISSIEEIGANEPVHFSPGLVEMLSDICAHKTLSYRKLVSGAGHDAMYMNRVTDTAMIFVPSVCGKSHCEEEYTSWEDIENGTNVLFEALKRLTTIKK